MTSRIVKRRHHTIVQKAQKSKGLPAQHTTFGAGQIYTTNHKQKVKRKEWAPYLLDKVVTKRNVQTSNTTTPPASPLRLNTRSVRIRSFFST